MVFIHLAEGFEEIEAITIVDLLRRANIDAKTISITGDKGVTGAHGIKVMADLLFEEACYDKCKMIVLPGGMPGAKNLDEHEELGDKIIEFNEQGKWLTAICAAPLVLGHMGVLLGRDAVCYPGFEEELQGAEVKNDDVCIYENIITSRGPSTAISFALELITVLSGEEESERIKKGLLLR